MSNKVELQRLLDTSPMWTLDRWGNYKIQVSSGHVYRLVLKDKVVRLESKTAATSLSDSRWVKIQSGFYKNIKLDLVKRLVLISGSKAIKL